MRPSPDVFMRTPLNPLGRAALNNLIGESRAMLAVREQILNTAPNASNVLITGESGTGKELVARALHQASRRWGLPLVAVNCAAIPEPLFESQLFGHTRGAFTGAVQASRGLLSTADHGTLFLDEIGELPLTLQVKLLRVIEGREVLAVGAHKPVSLDLRIIASTNRLLAHDVAAGRFRGDLFYRLKVVHIALPPLREHSEDIPLLVAHLVSRLNTKLSMDIDGITDDALSVLMRHPWKGNVRELEHVIESAMVAGRAGKITADKLPADLRRLTTGTHRRPTLKEAVRSFERQHVLDALALTGYDKKEAARRLGVSLTSLYRKLGAGSADDRSSGQSL